MKNDSSFIKWLGINNHVVLITQQVIAGTLRCDIISLSDGRVFVNADRALVSYDKGFYESFNKGDIVDITIQSLIDSYNNW